ncbi:unnamed protein product, partial [Ectocarpus fasciculatus]
REAPATYGKNRHLFIDPGPFKSSSASGVEFPNPTLARLLERQGMSLKRERGVRQPRPRS